MQATEEEFWVKVLTQCDTYGCVAKREAVRKKAGGAAARQARAIAAELKKREANSAELATHTSDRSLSLRLPIRGSNTLNRH